MIIRRFVLDADIESMKNWISDEETHAMWCANLRGKGVAVEMLKLAVSQAFKNPETEAVQLNVFAENIRAKKCYEKAGFVQRNITPDAFKYKDECWGRCNMVIKK